MKIALKKWNGALTLGLLVTAVYLPFLNFRMIRSAGDEKVYVSQSVEMASSGHWFLQTFMDRADYYKGPLHYLLIRLGTVVLGWNMMATVWMNFVFILLAALALGAVVKRHFPKNEDLALWTGGAFAFSIGVFSFAFSSQMEAELACFYCFGLYFLDLSVGILGTKITKRSTEAEIGELSFWITAGVMGWIKSPLYSVLLGVSGLIYWALSGALLSKITRVRSWVYLLVGIIICALGFAPAYLWDHETFVRTYIDRETFHKSTHHGTWDEAVVSLFTFFLIPWFFLALTAYLDGLTRLVTFYRQKKNLPLLLSFSFLLPTILFFCLHPYHGQSYNLPLVGALFLGVAALWNDRSAFFKPIYRMAYGLTALTFLVIPVLLTLLAGRYTPLPGWWPAWLVPVSWLVSIVPIILALKEAVLEKIPRPRTLIFGAAAVYFSLALLLAVLGERELLDVRTELSRLDRTGEKFQITYYDLYQNLWSEWGYMNYMLGRPVRAAHTPEQLTAALKAHDLFLLSDEGSLSDLKTRASGSCAEFEVTPWKRWTVIHWQNEQGVPYWLASWRSHDLSLLERNAFIARCRN